MRQKNANKKEYKNPALRERGGWEPSGRGPCGRGIAGGMPPRLADRLVDVAYFTSGQ
jgi:hypothetical protein